MRYISTIKLLLIFAVTFSLSSLPGTLAGTTVFPHIPLARATVAPTEAWYPAGPSLNTELVSIFTDETGEFNALRSTPPTIDLTDSPLFASDISPLTANSNFYVTSPISEHGYFELEFDLANNFWGCLFNFGNAACGIDFRQGIAHLLDKSIFTSTDPIVGGKSVPIDNPIQPSNGGLTAANPCSWDPRFPQTSTTNCVVGAPGGTAYHLNLPSQSGGPTVNFPWQPQIGSPDFCAAATHFAKAFQGMGIAVPDPILPPTGNCVLSPPSTGWPSSVTGNAPNFFIRSDSPARFNLGNGVSQEICALFTGSLTVGCSGFLGTTLGPITAFPGFKTPKTGLNLSWWIYTAAFIFTFPFDSTLYFEYNSLFASITSSDSPPCSNQGVSTTAASDYMYVCDPTYDSISSQMEFASPSCFSTAGDPAPGSATTTYAACGLGATDFAVSSGSVLTGLPLAQSSALPLTVTSLGSFAGTVALASVVGNSTVAGRPTASLSTLSVPLLTGVYANPTLTIITTSATPTGVYLVNVTGTSGTLTHTITVKVTVTTAVAITGLGTVLGVQDTPLSAISAGVQTEDRFGRGAYTIPTWSQKDQFAYLSGGVSCPLAVPDTCWHRVINNEGVGIPTYFTWLNAWNPNPAVPQVIRQGFKQTTSSLNPYQASTFWDFNIIGNIFDTLTATNPLNNAQDVDYMVTSHSQKANNQLGYTPPAGTVTSFRVTLRNDLYWHDGQQVTAWDVKYSYITCKAQGSFQCSLLGPMTGVTVLSRNTFDINLNAAGPFTYLFLTGVSVFPGHLWSQCGVLGSNNWGSLVASGSVPDSCIVPFSGGGVDVTSGKFDPLATTAALTPTQTVGFLTGSGPWICKNLATGVIGAGCSNTGTQNPPPGSGTYTLTRNGVGTTPGQAVIGTYFRASGTLALYIWTGNTGSPSGDFLNFLTVVGCFNKPLGTAGCTHWQTGIGNLGKTVLGFTQILEVARFEGIGWTPPFAWSQLTGIGTLPPVLYEGTATLNPCIDFTNPLDPGYNC